MADDEKHNITEIIWT